MDGGAALHLASAPIEAPLFPSAAAPAGQPVPLGFAVCARWLRIAADTEIRHITDIEVFVARAEHVSPALARLPDDIRAMAEALGEAQRVLAALAPFEAVLRPLITHRDHAKASAVLAVAVHMMLVGEGLTPRPRTEAPESADVGAVPERPLVGVSSLTCPGPHRPGPFGDEASPRGRPAPGGEAERHAPSLVPPAARVERDLAPASRPLPCIGDRP